VKIRGFCGLICFIENYELAFQKTEKTLGDLKKTSIFVGCFERTALVVLFWYFRKKCHGFVNQWKASLKWVAFFLLFIFTLRVCSGCEVQRCKVAKGQSLTLRVLRVWGSEIQSCKASSVTNLINGKRSALSGRALL
jgi:hypothetical protein